MIVRAHSLVLGLNHVVSKGEALFPHFLYHDADALPAPAAASANKAATEQHIACSHGSNGTLVEPVTSP